MYKETFKRPNILTIFYSATGSFKTKYAKHLALHSFHPSISQPSMFPVVESKLTPTFVTGSPQRAKRRR